MAEKKDEKKAEEKKKGSLAVGEGQLPEVVDRVNEILSKEFAGRPYLMVVATGYEIGNDGDKSTFAAQWSWRSNVIMGSEGGERLATFLSDQLQEAANHPENGVKKTYAKKQ
jgi:hypothetical protein